MALDGADRFVDETAGEPPVKGYIHRPAAPSGNGLVLTHGAGGNSQAPLLVGLAEALAEAGVSVLRCDLPFRQVRPHGPPSPGNATRDQQGLRRAVALLKAEIAGQVVLGGVSYGGRQASMLAAADASVASGLLLLSYPLHPPGRHEQLRTAHFPTLQVPTLFVQGTRDSFGTIEELKLAICAIPARTELIEIPGAGHGLLTKSNRAEVVASISKAFLRFFSLRGKTGRANPAH